MALSELIKYEGDNSTFIWKYPHEDFNNMTELIVHESQEAIFFANGQAADTFGPGRYKLDRTSQALNRASYMTAEAEAEARIKAAQRGAILEEQTTETEIARREAERKLIQAQAEAQAAKMSGMAEASVMQAKGYNQKDVLQAEVQKAYAEGIGNMGPAVSAGGGSSVMGDMLGMGVGMAAMSAMAPQIGEMMKGFNSDSEGNQSVSTASSVSGSSTESLICKKCGKTLPANAKFCLECGTKVEVLADNEMICPVCGKKNPKGKFCLECGAPLANKCPNCGAEIPQGGKFCLECGNKLY